MSSWLSHEIGAVVAGAVQGALPRPGPPPVSAVSLVGGIMPAPNGPVGRGKLPVATFMVT